MMFISPMLSFMTPLANNIKVNVKRRCSERSRWWWGRRSQHWGVDATPVCINQNTVYWYCLLKYYERNLGNTMHGFQVYSTMSSSFWSWRLEFLGHSEQANIISMYEEKGKLRDVPSSHSAGWLNCPVCIKHMPAFNLPTWLAIHLRPGPSPWMGAQMSAPSSIMHRKLPHLTNKTWALRQQYDWSTASLSYCINLL